MHPFSKIVSILLLTIVLFACNNKKREDAPVFYFWKTTYELTEIEKLTLKQLQCEKMYVRLFDVEWDTQSKSPMPMAKLKTIDTLNKFKIVPVVYFNDEVFLNIEDSAIILLAQKVAEQIDIMAANRDFDFNEYQIDCDWTASSKKRYFEFLVQIKKILAHKTLNCTLRFNQIKHRKKLGIPPADKGTVLFYNMGKLTAKLSDNSIYNDKDAKQYSKCIQNYSLRLDAALPIFSWAIQCRKDSIVNLLPRRELLDFADTSIFLYDGKYIRVKQNSFYKGVLFKINDYIKLETISEEDCEKAAKILAKNAPKAGFENILYFDLDEKTITRFNHEKIRDLHVLLPN